MSPTFARLITIGILGPTAVAIHIAAHTVSRSEGAIMICVFLLVYGLWAFVLGQRIEVIMVREIYNRLKSPN